MKCRACHHDDLVLFANLGSSPPSNSFLKGEELNHAEVYYPLQVSICPKCWLAQLDEYKSHEEIFSKDYVYFSSFSASWVKHAAKYVQEIAQEFKPSKTGSLWIEVASNDGYLLESVKKAGLPCLGIEPTTSTANVSREKGIETISEFFGVKLGQRLSKEGKKADIMSANNVLAHVPDLHDFLGGFRETLKPEGLVTFEFPLLLSLLGLNQFDTIYHEHFSYLSLTALQPLLKSEKLRAFRAQRIPTHGGSVRLFVCHENAAFSQEGSVSELLKEEERAGLKDLKTYLQFQNQIEKVKNDFAGWLIEQKNQGRRVCAYGAAAKGNTLINYAGIRPDLLSFVVDASPYKQGLYLPGSHIPVLSLQQMKDFAPDSVVILPWNLAEEISQNLRREIRPDLEMVVAVPELRKI